MAKYAAQGIHERYESIDLVTIKLLKEFGPRRVVTPTVIESLLLKQRSFEINDWLFFNTAEDSDEEDFQTMWNNYDKGQISFTDDETEGETTGGIGENTINIEHE